MIYDLSNSQRPPDVLPAKMLANALEHSPLASLVMPIGFHAEESVEEERSRQQMLLVALACHEFYRNHGRFPKTSSELVGKYLKEIPRDPFSSTGARLNYRRDADGAVIWSVGQNGNDDDGNFSLESLDRDIGYELRPPGIPPPKKGEQGRM